MYKWTDRIENNINFTLYFDLAEILLLSHISKMREIQMLERVATSKSQTTITFCCSFKANPWIRGCSWGSRMSKNMTPLLHLTKY